MKHLISIDDFEPGERAALFELADELIHPTAISTQAMAGKILLMYFMSPPPEHQLVSIAL